MNGPDAPLSAWVTYGTLGAFVGCIMFQRAQSLPVEVLPLATYLGSAGSWQVRTHDALLHRDERGARTVADSQLRVDVFHVVAHCLGTDAESARDPFVRLSDGQQRKDLALAGRKT